jgi:hypothetical protein
VCVDTDIRFRPCCVFRKRSGNTIEAGGLDWNTYNLTFISDVKTAMETGWHIGCEGCRLDEELGKDSQRMQYNQTFTGVNNQLEFLDSELSIPSERESSYYSSIKLSKS